MSGRGIVCRPGVVSLQKQRAAGLSVKGLAVNSACTQQKEGLVSVQVEQGLNLGVS